MERTIEQVFQADAVINDGDMRLLRALPQAQRTALGPFVFFDHYRHESLRGIGDRPHPHAGIEVVSYLLDGGLEHRDSIGFRDRLDAGDAQFICAGRGMLHAEQPLSGRHGLQLWTSLPPDLKMLEPTYQSFRAAEIPEIVADGSRLRIIAGRVQGVAGPMPLNDGDAVFSALHLDPGATVSLSVDAEIELGVYVLQGQIDVRGQSVGLGSLAFLGRGDRVTISAHRDEAVDVALIGGNPVQGDVLFLGPFVMDTPQRLAQVRRDFIAGRMGRLEGVPF